MWGGHNQKQTQVDIEIKGMETCSEKEIDNYPQLWWLVQFQLNWIPFQCWFKFWYRTMTKTLHLPNTLKQTYLNAFYL